MTPRSMNAPGSPSSALQTMYFSVPGAFLANCHFFPVGNPPPPRPRRPDLTMRSTTRCGSLLFSTSASAL